jgi:Secretion system C-terminal sorting domain
MKKYIFLLFVTFQCCASTLRSQCVDSDLKADNDPYNLRTTFGSTVNFFDWRQQTYDFNLINPVTNQSSMVTRRSPFFWLQGSENIKHLQEQPLLGKDFQPSDGWELLQYYFGTSSDPKRIPYIVLYNRLEGMIRVFCYVPSGFDYSYNAARIDIKFVKNSSVPKFYKNGMLAFANMPARGLDKFDKNIVSSAPTFVNSDGNFWLYADFPISYDPCTCNYLTNIFITPFLMKMTKIEETQESIVAAGTGATVNNGSGILPILNEIIPQIDAVEKKGAAISKSLTTGLNFVEKLLPKTKVIETKNFFTEDDNPELAESMVSRSVKSNTVKFPAWAKELPKIGYVIGLIELFTGGGKSQPTPSIAQSRQRFKISGTQTTDFPLTPIDLYVPGSAWPRNSGNILAAPYYDNTLGVFALVETPRIVYKAKSQQKTGVGYSYTNTSGQNVSTSTYNFVGWDFKLQDDIKYAINPASGYNQTPVDIKASLIFNVKAKCLGTARDPRQGAVPPFCTFNSPITSSLKVTRLGTSDTVTIQTPLMSLSCIKDYVAHLSFAGNVELKSSDGTNYYATAKFAEDVRIQIVAILEQETNASKQHTFIAQYKLFPEPSSVDIPNTAISDIALNPVIENLTLTANTTIRGWETVTLKGNINTNGFTLTVIAGKNIDVLNPQLLSPNVNLLIGVPINCQSTASAMTPKQLYSFCGKLGEKKYDPIATLVGEDEDVNSLKSVRNMTTSLSVAPNPFNNQLSIQYELQEASQVTVSLSNALGQTVKVLVNEKVEAGSYQINESTADLPSGVYIITMKTPTGMKTQKVVKQSN